MKQKKVALGERGSLSLEHILFIGAVVLITAGLATFYGNINTYFANVGFNAPPANVGGNGGGVVP